jgi:CheY-like chemotaxis protein
MGKILIVDDKTENLYLLQSLLETSDFKTISANWQEKTIPILLFRIS